MKFKNFFKKKHVINKKTIHEHVDFMDIESCRRFLNEPYSACINSYKNCARIA